MGRLSPDFAWIRNYQRAWLSSDIAAGLTLGAVMIPVGLAFGELAGLPLAGLYAGIFPLLAYVLFGSSRQLIVGPDATMAAVVAVSVAPLAHGDLVRFAALVAILGLWIGFFCILGSVLRMGFMADFLAKQVVVGFIHGLALIIFVGQLPKVLGISSKGDTPLLQIQELAKNIGATNLYELVIGLACVAVILGCKRWIPRLPGQIVALLGSIAAVHFLGLEKIGVQVVGNIPSGIPAFKFPLLAWKDWMTLAPIGFGAALVAFSDAVVTARAFASRNRYRIDANRELLGLGMGNIAAALFQGLPISGSGSRTAVAESVGSRSKATSLVAALAVALAMLFLTPYLRQLPNAALGGILIAAAWNLCDFPEFARIWRFRRVGFVIALLVFFGVIGIGVMEGIGIGVVLSLVLVVRFVSFPHDAVLGSLNGQFHDITRRPEAKTVPGVLIYRFLSPLFFANCTLFQTRLEALVDSAEVPLRAVIINAAPMLGVDLAGCETLIEIGENLRRRGIRFMMADVRDSVRDYLERGGVIESLGPQSFPPNLAAALGECQ